jgi:hypothetical protein
MRRRRRSSRKTRHPEATCHPEAAAEGSRRSLGIGQSERSNRPGFERPGPGPFWGASVTPYFARKSRPNSSKWQHTVSKRQRTELKRPRTARKYKRTVLKRQKPVDGDEMRIDGLEMGTEGLVTRTNGLAWRTNGASAARRHARLSTPAHSHSPRSSPRGFLLDRGKQRGRMSARQFLRRNIDMGSAQYETGREGTANH